MNRMKDGIRVIRGTVATGTYGGVDNRIHLFDGRFDTGYKILEFQITPQFPANNIELVGKLCCEPDTKLEQFNWDQVNQMAWALWNVPITSRFAEWSLSPREDIVVEDLWISSYASGESTNMNYYIKLEKYQMADWDGAAAMVRNLSQAGPN